MKIRVIPPIITAGLILVSTPVLAQGVADFTFKRLTPPQDGQDGLLNIQVEPQPEIQPVLSGRVDPDKDLSLAPELVRTEAPWFWHRFATGLQDGAPHRLELARTILEENPTERAAFGENPVRIATIARDFGADILRASVEAQVSPALLLAVIEVESGGNPGKGAPTGPAGLMQLKPAVAHQFGIGNVMDPLENIIGGARYLEWLLDRFDGDALLALAAFHTAEPVVRGAGGIPNNPETRLYIPRVIAAWRLARDLCITPPVKATDGCVFKDMGVSG